MPIDEIRAKQKADQMKAIKTRLEAGSIVRIGNRLPITGRYEVLDSDGGISNNGVKVYNAQEQYGDRVLAYPRSDDTIALDSEKGSIVRPPTAFPTCPGYLQGQVFNCEEPKKKKVENFWVLFSLGGKMFVGGHKSVPEMIYDSTPPNKPLDLSPGSSNILQIWGDGVGWEASFSIGGTTAVFVTPDGPIQRTVKSTARGGSIIDFNFPLYGARHLGKGIWISRYGIIESPGYGLGSFNYTWTETWKNTIVDADGVAFGNGAGTVFSSDIDAQLSGTSSRIESATFPDPYPLKTTNYSSIRTFRDTNTPVKIDNTVTTEVDSHGLILRDRTYSLFSKTNSEKGTSIGVGMIYPIRVTEFFISDGKNEIALFSVNDFQHDALDSTVTYMYDLFGATPQYSTQESNDSYKFNNPSVTQVQGRSQLLTHLNALKSYDVKVFNVFRKASLIDGEHTIEKVDAWGIPVGAVIHDVAAWVP